MGVSDVRCSGHGTGDIIIVDPKERNVETGIVPERGGEEEEERDLLIQRSMSVITFSPAYHQLRRTLEKEEEEENVDGE